MFERSFQIIAGRYIEKAISFEREDWEHAKKLHGANPLYERQGLDPMFPGKTGVDGLIINYWMTGNQEILFKNSKRSLLLESATLFFAEYLREERPIRKTISDSQRYGLLSVIYGKFNQICEKLEELSVHPREGGGCYFAALHRLTEDISNYLPPQEQPPGTVKNSVNALRRELEMAAKILDDFPPPEGNVLRIPKGYWESLLKKTFEVEVLPDPKTISKYRKGLERTISYEYYLDLQCQWNRLPGDFKPQSPTYQEIAIKIKK